MTSLRLINKGENTTLAALIGNQIVDYIGRYWPESGIAVLSGDFDDEEDEGEDNPGEGAVVPTTNVEIQVLDRDCSFIVFRNEAVLQACHRAENAHQPGVLLMQLGPSGFFFETTNQEDESDKELIEALKTFISSLSGKSQHELYLPTKDPKKLN